MKALKYYQLMEPDRTKERSLLAEPPKLWRSLSSLAAHAPPAPTSCAAASALSPSVLDSSAAAAYCWPTFWTP
ncbi:hypothetical protein EVAR_84573_1 [Eumeta japonica]|uniref:Uncharacterized protein n=1 Tax=Eumeta variegata TaxID=151549 RepID=A0A4C1UHQ2_EUMVA|nr:hypothetical protein EVAR_84573_1 [Eumeta japonica]